MKINIYQIAPERDEKRLRFFPLSALETLNGTRTVDSTLYNKVYSADVRCKTLEDVYEKFNTDHPVDYFAHSLSVSDVVEIVEGGNLKKGFYYCDEIGFTKIEFNVEKTVDTTDKDKITVLYIQTMKPPQVIKIPDNQTIMENIIGGKMDEYHPFADDVALICDRSSKDKKPLNRSVYTEPDKNGNRELMDIIAGNFFICLAPINEGRYKSLPDNLIKKYSDMFRCPERFIRSGNNVTSVKIIPRVQDFER